MSSPCFFEAKAFDFTVQPLISRDRTPNTTQDWAIAGSSPSLISECYATRTDFKMATLSIRRFLVLVFPI